MGAFGWTVVGSVAGVVSALAAIAALVPRFRRRKVISGVPAKVGSDVLSAEASENVPAVVGNIPREPLCFQDRADLLAAFDTPGTPPRVVVVQAVTGMRGVGKTHLAAAYARARLAERWRLVAWIDAEDLRGVLGGLMAVAAGLGLGDSGGNAAAAGMAVRHRLEVDGNHRLLVFDNATDPAVLEPFIPVVGLARVIVTSNQRSMANLGTGVPVDAFSKPEALAFLAERTGLSDVKGACALAAELGYLPLALAQAGAVIADQNLEYGTYMERLSSMPVDELLIPVEAGQYPRGVAAAVLLSLEDIRAADDNGVCTSVMELVAVLSSGGVRRTLMREAGHQGVLGRNGRAGELAPEVVDRALARLAGASLLTFSVDGSSISAHRLVIRLVREQLAARNSLTVVCAVAAKLLDSVAGSLRSTWYKDRAAVNDLIEQIMALYESCVGCADDSRLVMSILRLRAFAVGYSGHLHNGPAQLIPTAESLLADAERVLGADHEITLDTRDNLALACREAGRTAEAITLHDQNLPDMERVLGAEHPKTMITRNHRANAYRQAGRTAEAIALFEQNLPDMERVLGADDLTTLATRNNLANAYTDAGRTAEAIAMYKQALADMERVLGADGHDTLATRDNLACAYRVVGRTAEAITLHEQALADMERVLSADHPTTLNTRDNLAIAYLEAGRTAEAIASFEQNLPDMERVLGADHPTTLATRDNLAIAYRAAGRTPEAMARPEESNSQPPP